VIVLSFLFRASFSPAVLWSARSGAFGACARTHSESSLLKGGAR
jgi:hypothetical protein